MTSKVVLITPPDKIFNQNSNLLLIYPGLEIRSQLQQILAKSNKSQNVYVYSVNEEYHDIDWLLSIAKMSEIIILELDNCPVNIKALSSYLISLPNTYWLTADDVYCYNKLSANRIYGLDAIENIIGGSVEEQ